MSEGDSYAEERFFQKFPKNDGPLPEHQGHARLTGPCGETMEFWLIVHDDRVRRVSFVSDGCGTSHGCGSMAAILAEGESVDEAKALGQRDILDALGGLPEESRHCALLAANALKAACDDYLCRRPETAGEAGDPGA